MRLNYIVAIIWLVASFGSIYAFASNGYSALEAMFIGSSFLLYNMYILAQEIINKIESKFK